MYIHNIVKPALIWTVQLKTGEAILRGIDTTLREWQVGHICTTRKEARETAAKETNKLGGVRRVRKAQVGF